jgi:hypothetical protein
MALTKAQIIQVTVFMKRAQLNGEEVPVYNGIMTQLQTDINKLIEAEEKSAKSKTPKPKANKRN